MVDHSLVRVRLVACAAIGVLAAALLTPPTAAGASPSEELVTGRISGKADYSDTTSSFTNKVVTAGYGRFVAFTGNGNDQVPGLPSGSDRVYLRDTLTDALELVSVRADGSPATSSTVGAVSPNGRFVAFVSYDKLVAADTNSLSDVYVRDRELGTNDLVSVSSAEVPGNAGSGNYAGGAPVDISDNGRYVVFESDATNLVATDANDATDVFRRDRTAGTTIRVSQNAALEGNGGSSDPEMSSNGSIVVFTTNADNMIPNDTNGLNDVVLRDLNQISPVRVSLGLDANPDGGSAQASISDDGTKVAFHSVATDLVANDTNAKRDVFVRNIANSTTTRVSVAANGSQLNQDSSVGSISPNGQEVSFDTIAQADASDTDAKVDVFLRESGTTVRQSVGAGGAGADFDAFGSDVSTDTVVFRTASGLATVDGNAKMDAYQRRWAFVGVHPTIEDFVATTRARIAKDSSPAGVTSGAAAIRAGASPEHQVISLVDLPAFSAKKAPVIRLYWAYFKRRPDLGGLKYWIKQYEGGKSLQRISLQFATSSEFTNTYGSKNPTQFVTLVYENVLERAPEPDGLTYWTNKIVNGTSRGQVMTNFSESPEGKRVMAPYVDTVLVGLGLMDKIVSQTIFDGVVPLLKGGSPRETIVDYLIGTPEYLATLP